MLQVTNATKIASPLSRTTVLVAVNISQWTARKLDRRATAETNERHGASADAGRYNKLLIEAKRLETINGIVSAARTLHYKMTRPWADEGLRILPNALYEEFSNKFRVLKREFEDAAEAFCREYPCFIKEREADLGSLYDPKDYPAVEEIRSKFNLELRVLPFPDAEDFRSDLDNDTVADIRREIADTTNKVVDDAMKATAREIVERVGHMAEKLKTYKGKGTTKKGEPNTYFRDSLVENVRELAKLLPAFNLTNDPKVDAVIERINRELCVEDAQTLREHAGARAIVAKSADEIVAEVGKFLA